MCVLLCYCSLNAKQRVIGGSDANISEAPWQALVRTPSLFGGGCIIGPNLILTASHVLGSSSPSQIQVNAGISKKSEADSYNTYEVSQVINHPTLDAALLILSRDLTFGNDVKFINVLGSSNASLYNAGNTVLVTGWGTSDDAFEYPDQLQKVNLTIVDNSEFPSPIGLEYVVGIANGKRISSGDSGGPWAIWDSSLSE